MWLKVLNLEQSLFPRLQEAFGPLSPKEEKLMRILDFAEIEQFVTTVQITNPPKDREQMARAFVAKSVYNFQTTRELIERLKVDKRLRMLCGWQYSTDVPSESKFSRVFEVFSRQKLAVKAHNVFIENYLGEILFLYGSTDSTDIELREKAAKKEKSKQGDAPKRKRGRPRKEESVPPPKEPTVLQRQEQRDTTEEMLSLIPTQCDVGIKQNAKGNRYKWIGGKLHMTVVDGDIPVTAMYASASVHDSSSMALPMINETSTKVHYLYDLDDAAYDSRIIKAYSKSKAHRPIVDINPKTPKPSKSRLP